MRRSNSRLSFDRGFSLARKILILIVLGCFLAIFGLGFAEEAIDPDFEHPWDDLQSPGDEGPLEVFELTSVTVLPLGHLSAFMVIEFPQAKTGKADTDRVETGFSGKVRGKVSILF
jgi:hypothetical protein